MKYKLLRIYDVFRYDIPRFLKNIIHFRKALWDYCAWDYSGLLILMETAAKDMSAHHKNHGHLVRSEEIAKELLIWAELLKRAREDDYTKDKQRLYPNGDGPLLFKFEQIPGRLPSIKSKSFYKLIEAQRKNDLRLAAKLFERKVLHWWD